MAYPPVVVHDEEVAKSVGQDRWGKCLIGGDSSRTSAGFNLGYAVYHVQEFGPVQVHDDQEALFVLEGEGEIRLGASPGLRAEVHPIRPGDAVYIPPRCRHAVRRTGERPVKAMQEPFAISQPALSQHLQVLRRAGLVSSRRIGREHWYRLNAEPLAEVAAWIARYERFWRGRLNALGDHLDRNP